jgi:hypothetical protein
MSHKPWRPRRGAEVRYKANGPVNPMEGWVGTVEAIRREFITVNWLLPDGTSRILVEPASRLLSANLQPQGAQR